MAEVTRAESWSEVQAGGGVRRAVLSHLLSLTERVSLPGEHTVTLETAFDHPAVVTLDTPADETNFQIGRVIRLAKANGSRTEHRISESVKINEAGRTRRRLVAQSIWLDLALRGIITRYIGQGMRTTSFSMQGLTAIEHWNQFIYPALVEGQAFWWALDMQVPASLHAQPVKIEYNNDTPLSGLQKIAAALGSLEMSMGSDDESYTVIMQRQVGETAAPIVALARRNLVSLGYTESQTNQATRIFPVGPQHEAGRATIGEAEWRLSGAVPLREPHPTDGTLELITITLLDEAGGPGPIQFAGQFVPLPGEPIYVLTWTTAVFILPIYATNPADQTVTLQANVGQEVPYLDWHRVKFARKSIPAVPGDNNDLTYVEHPTMRTRYGALVMHFEVPEVPPTNNLIPNPLMRQWPPGSVLPTGWSKNPLASMVITRATAPGEWDTAGQAMRVQMTAADHIIACPPSIASHATEGFISFFARLKVLSGSARVYGFIIPALIDANGGLSLGSGFQQFPDPLFGDPDAKTTAINVWQDIGVAAAFDLLDPGLIALPNAVYLLSVDIAPATGTTTCDVLIDSVQVTNTSDQRPLLEGNAGVRLFQAGNERLLRYADPAVTLDANLLDLGSFDPARFLYDELVLGGPVRVLSPEIEVDVLTRITGWTRDSFHGVNTRVDISSARPDLMTLLARPAGTARRVIP